MLPDRPPEPQILIFLFLEMSSPTTYEEAYEETPTIDSNESGYASGSSSQDSLPDIYFSKPHLKFINSQLQKLEPQGK